MRRCLVLPRELWIEIFGKSWSRAIERKGPCLYVCTDGSRRACGVGACARLLPTKSDPRETSGPQIDRIPSTRPSWRDRQYRELKKSLFSPPSKCTIDLFGPLSNRMIFKQLHVAIHFVASVLRRHGMGTTIHSLSTVTYLVLVLPPWLGHSSYHRSTPPPVACQRSAAAGGTQVVVDS